MSKKIQELAITIPTFDISASKVVKTMELVNETIGSFIPFVTVISVLTKEISETFDNVQYNKSTYAKLVTRVQTAEASIKGLVRENTSLSQNYYKSFKKYVACLEKIKEFCDDISQLPKFKKFYSSRNIKEKFQEIIKEFDSCSTDLNLGITLTTNEQMNKYMSCLHNDMISMKKFLDNVEGGITSSINSKTEQVITNTNEIQIQNQEIIFKLNNLDRKIIKILEYEDNLKFSPLNEEIYSLNEEINNNQNSTLEAKRIIPSELIDSPKYVRPRGSRVTIQKKIYKGIDVACKSIVSMDNIQKIQKHLAILSKLTICPYIIQFHGLSEIEGENVMVFEWAEHGTLRDLYRNFKITWEAKIFIARDICRGIAFLHSVNILHHDLKCENILITENMLPKISNFNFAREFSAATHTIDSFNDIIHWLAPEKLKCIPIGQKSDRKKLKEVKYTIQCEIYSFGMLLWELGFQRKPYENKKMMEILKHVLNGGRETLDIGSYPNSIEKEYCAIIKLAWEQEPSLRPGIGHLFNMLQTTYENHNIFSLLQPIPVDQSQVTVVSLQRLLSFLFTLFFIIIFILLYIYWSDFIFSYIKHIY